MTSQECDGRRDKGSALSWSIVSVKLANIMAVGNYRPFTVKSFLLIFTFIAYVTV